jgi:uncharacterized protein (DUF983 family)
LHQADDFPPYVSILLTGHLIAPVLILIGGSAALTMGAKIALAMVLAGGLDASLAATCQKAGSSHCNGGWGCTDSSGWTR